MTINDIQLTSDDMDCHIGDTAHAGVAGVLTGVGHQGRVDHQGGDRGVALLRDQAHPLTTSGVGDWLKYKIKLKMIK